MNLPQTPRQIIGRDVTEWIAPRCLSDRKQRIDGAPLLTARIV
jgi:hypothetical protein